MFDVIAFDADDTLWHNETRFRKAEEFFKKLLGDHAEEAHIDDVLYRCELKNIATCGYGAKTFTLSMVEAAIELSERKVTASEVEEIIQIGNEILTEPLLVFDGVREVLEELKRDFDLMIVTKGDLMEQENKIRRSGLGDFFRYTEIVTEKCPDTYGRILEKYDFTPERFLMVGNSLKSDVLPVRDLGAHAVHIPYHTTWIHEQVPDHVAEASDHDELADLSELPQHLAKWGADKEPTGG